MVFEATICTGSTSQLSDSARADFEALIDSIESDGIEGKIAERQPTGAGVTWVEVTEIYLAVKAGDALVEFAYDKALEALTARVVAWLRTRKLNGRPQSVTVRSISNEPERKIEMDLDGKVTEHAWVRVERPTDRLDVERSPVGEPEDGDP